MRSRQIICWAVLAMAVASVVGCAKKQEPTTAPSAAPGAAAAQKDGTALPPAEKPE